MKPYIKFNMQKRIEAEKNNNKDGKALYKLMNNAIYEKTMDNFRKRIDVKLVDNEKDYLNVKNQAQNSRTEYMAII